MGGARLRFVPWRGSALPFALPYTCGPSSRAPLLTPLRYTDAGGSFPMGFAFAGANGVVGLILIHWKDREHSVL